MILRITLKDIAAFVRSEKRVFFWLLACMVGGSFVLNYSYSFARYQGRIFDWMNGADKAKYGVVCSGAEDIEKASAILDRVSKDDFPEIDNYQLHRDSEDGYTVTGSTELTLKVTGGMWIEGYHRNIENVGNVCAMSTSLVDYGDRIKMTGESVVIDGEEFTVRGVFIPYRSNVKALIFADKFIEKYDDFTQISVTFKERLNDVQQSELERVVRENVTGRVTVPPKPGSANEEVTRSSEMGFSMMAVILVLCLVVLLKYWQQVNLPAYTVYWINGATNGTIMRIALCESLLLCVVTYAAGLGLNVLMRKVFSGVFSATAPLELSDIVMGFVIFFGTFTIFTVINAAKICKTFRVTNVRRD